MLARKIKSIQNILDKFNLFVIWPIFIIKKNKIFLNLKPISNTKPVAKKTVKIKENDLVDLIDGLVTEAVAVKKTEWLAEQAKKDADKSAILESRLSTLEKLIAKK